MWPLEESHGLYWGPADHDSLAWSEDNLIAVASGAGAVILNPCDLEGVVATTPAAVGNFCHLEHLPLAALHTQGSSILCSAVLQALQPGSFNSDCNGYAKVRAIAWSPSGLSSVGGCVLGAVTDDFRVKLYARPAAGGALEWECFLDLADRLAGHLGNLPIPNLEEAEERAASPEPAAGPEPAAAQDPAAAPAASAAPKAAREAKRNAASLPGTPAAAAGAFAAGQEVEVAVDDAGLQDDWFVGSVQQVAPGHLLVRYGASEAGGERQEWFSRPDTREAAEAPTTGHAVRGAGCTLRPPPPPPPGGQAFRGRDRVDVWQDGRWQAGALTRTRNLKARRQQPARTIMHVRPAGGGGEERMLPPGVALRHSLAWRGGVRWDRLPKAAALTTQEKTPGASAAGSPPAATPAAQAPAQGAAMVRSETRGAQPAAPGPSTAGRPSAGDAAEPGTASAGDAGGASPEAGRPAAVAGGGRGRGRGGARSTSPTPAARSRGRGRMRGASSSAGRGRGRRKRAASSETEPDDDSDSEFDPQGSEASSEGGAARVLAGLASGARGAKRARGSPAAAAPAARAAPSPKKKAAAEQHIAEEYQVPADFDPSVLPSIGAADAKSAFLQDIAHAATERWLVLRCQIPEDEVPEYGKGAHMRGPDIVHYEQVRAEFTHAHAAALARWGVDQKLLNMECKRCIRTTAINPRMQFEDSDSDGEARAAEGGGAPPRRRRSQTELMLRRVRKLRAQRQASAHNRKQHPKKAKRPAAAPARVSGASIAGSSPQCAAVTAAGTAEAQSQLQLLMPTCLAWSGLLRLPGSGRRAEGCLLAVGTRAGAAWLWALQAQPPRLAPDPQAEAAGVRLVGRLAVGSAGLTCLAWVRLGAAPWLLAGDASGAVLAAPLNCAGLAPCASRVQPPPQLPATFAPLVPADGRGVTSLAADVAGGRVRVAAGKQSGVLAVWEGALPPGGGGELCSVPAAHGTLTLSGTAWLPQLGAAAGEACLLTAGCDGSAKAWRVRGSQARLAAELALQQLDGDAQPRQLQANALFGVAASGSGRLAAVVQETLNARQDTVQEVMVYRRLIKARVHLLPLAPALAWGPEAAAAAAAAALEQAAQAQGRLCAGRLWDLAAELHWQHLPTQAPPAGGEPAVCAAAATQALLSRLEAGAPALLAGGGDAAEAGQEPAWRRLQLANVLRRLLHPRRISQGEAETDDGSSPPATDLSRAWDGQLAANELLLLQRHLLRLLRTGTGAGLQLSRRLARQWGAQHAAALRPALLAACGPLDAGEQPACEQALGVAVRLTPTGQPLQTASMAESEGLGVRLARCGASLALLPPGGAWACGLCGRCYSGAAADAGLLPHLACVFCGTALGARHRAPGVCLEAQGWPARLPPPPHEEA